jgi:hypothetical protein
MDWPADAACFMGLPMQVLSKGSTKTQEVLWAPSEFAGYSRSSAEVLSLLPRQ